MPRRILRWIAFFGTLGALPLGAQQQTRGGTITGVVRDSAARPLAGADIIARPGDHRTRSDSAGRFTIDGLDPDNYTVRARKVGFLPESWDVKLTKSSRVDIAMVLDRQLPTLDTVVIRANRDCSQKTIEAFLCRRGRPGGVFLDDRDIDEKDVTYAGELFRTIPGFRVDFTIGPNGPIYIVRTQKLWGCINTVVNGRPPGIANYAPELASSLIAIEIYARPDSVPPEFERYTWPRGGLAKTGRCAVIAYWTDQSPRPLPRAKLPERASR